MDLKYPIGKFQAQEVVTSSDRAKWIEDIEQMPMKLKEAVQGLSEEQLDLPYREGGWTVRQVVHHLADSHMNSFIRFKLALTEDTPTIKAYNENAWSQLADVQNADIHSSLMLLEGLHKRMVILLQSMSESDFKKMFYHPGSQRHISLEMTLGLYAWHGKHHTAHITSLRERMGI